MDWDFMQQLYLAFTRIFDGLITFFIKTFKGEEEEA